ncbi:MAG TPA: hypothetical protein VLT47_11015 [Anaeromyxobacteraceae bacterium]|nr:hypothetical protein [Anaeromyxobacteraceae bacterium]
MTPPVWEDHETRIAALEAEMGHGPNLATGDEGAGLQKVLAGEVAARQAAETRAAFLRGILAGIGASLPALAALLTILRALGFGWVR